MTMDVRVATPADMDAILAMAEHFVSESAYGMQFDRKHAADYLSMLLAHPDVMVLVSDALSSFLVAAISLDWCVLPVCYVEKLYVMPEARGSGVARTLVDATLEFAISHNCSHVFSTSTAGMGDQVEKLYVNVFRKFGFEGCGPVLFRSL